MSTPTLDQRKAIAKKFGVNIDAQFNAAKKAKAENREKNIAEKREAIIKGMKKSGLIH